MKPNLPTPVKLFFGVLYSEEHLLQQAREKLIEIYGEMDVISSSFLFDLTTYYEEEMGAPIYRVFYSFRTLMDPGQLAHLKIQSILLEESLALNQRRKVNLDPGYLDYHKVVLASAKYEGHKIYLSDGIYADTTLRYSKGHFDPSPYCFPDFQKGQYEKTFLKMRERYKEELKKINFKFGV